MKHSISAVLVLTLCLVLSIDRVNAQRADMLKMTPEERKAYADKLRTASQADWQKTMQLFELSEPVLPRRPMIRNGRST